MANEKKKPTKRPAAPVRAVPKADQQKGLDVKDPSEEEPKQDTPPNKVAKKEVSSKDTLSKKTTKQEATAKATLPKTTAKKETAAKVTPLKKAPKHETAAKDIPKHSASKKASGLQKKRSWPKVAVSVLVVAAIVCVGLFSWNRWFRYSDGQDLQGTWIHMETGLPVEIGANSIALKADVEYHYTIDPWAKTISYSFNELKGSGTYQFSRDRAQLVITEGVSGNLVDDIANDLGLASEEEGESQNTIVLVKQ